MADLGADAVFVAEATLAFVLMLPSRAVAGADKLGMKH